MIDDVTLDANDRFALADLVAAYSRCVDRRDYPALAQLFAEGGRLGIFQTTEDTDDTVQWLEGGEAFASSVKARQVIYKALTHFLGQQKLTADGPDVTGETYCLAHHLYFENEQWVNKVMSIRYHDRFSRSERIWKFAERRVIVDWIEFRPMGATLTTDGWTPTS